MTETGWTMAGLWLAVVASGLYHGVNPGMGWPLAVSAALFGKGREEATRIMLHVHQHGVGICGVFTYEVAETKVNTVDTLARENGFPLKCIMERE